MDEADVREILRTVQDPDLAEDVVSLGLVNDITVEDGTAQVSLALGAPYAPHESEIANRVREALADEGIEAELTARVDTESHPKSRFSRG